MSTIHNPTKLFVKTNEEIAELYNSQSIGIETGYTLEDIRKEIAYRELIEEWSTEPTKTQSYE